MLIPTSWAHSLENNNASCVAGGGFDFWNWKDFPICLLKNELHDIVAEVPSSVSSGETVEL
jgi:hypothetical protein